MFIHIPRTGGTTISAAISARFGERQQWVKWSDTDLGGLAKIIRPDALIVHGHMPVGLHRYMPIRYATLLRHPVERFVSNYRLYCVQKRSRGITPEPFEGYCRQPERANVICKALLGQWEVRDPLDGSAPAAMDALRLFEFVGFLDDVAPFLSQLGLQAGAPLNAMDLAVDDLDLDLAGQVNREDLALYEWARAGSNGDGARIVDRGDPRRPPRLA